MHPTPVSPAGADTDQGSQHTRDHHEPLMTEGERNVHEERPHVALNRRKPLIAGAEVQLKFALIRATELTPPSVRGKRRGFGEHQLLNQASTFPLWHLQPVPFRNRSRPLNPAVPCIVARSS
jgi:hypothetical protein